MTDESNEVIIERQNGVMVITINRPEARNAINGNVSQTVCSAIDEFEAADGLRVGILTGAGNTFCSGVDFKAFLRGEVLRLPGRGLLGITTTPPKKPLIAAVEGYALAGGFEISLACDLMVSSQTATFGIPEVKRGLAALAGGLVRLPRAIPQRIALEMALTGMNVPAVRLERFGLINRLTEPGKALEEALELAASIVENAPLAVKVSKKVIQEQIDWPLAKVFDYQDDVAGFITKTKDAQEGATAFLEKRNPVWKEQ